MTDVKSWKSGASGLYTRRRSLLTLTGAAAAVSLGLPARAAPKTLRIGTTFDDSGVEKANGKGMYQGSRACFNALNRAGGVNGVPVELVMMDDQFNPEVAKSNALAFAADSTVLAVLHPLGTRQSASVIDAVPAMAVVGAQTGTIGLRKKNTPNAFWVRANYDQEVDKLIATADVLGLTRIGLVYPNDPFGQSVFAAFKTSLARIKREPAVIATTPNTISPEVEPAARAIAAANPQVVIAGLAGTAPALIKVLRAAGGNSTIYGLSITSSALTAMGDLAHGLGFSIVVPSPLQTKFEIVRRYQADMQASGFTDYTMQSLEGYIDASVLAEGLRRAGPAPTRASVIAGLERIENFDLGGFKVHYGPRNREGSQFVDVAVISRAGRILS